MKSPLLRAQRFRFILASAATGGSIDICAYERHFTLSPMHPDTYPVLLQHKCGLLFLICFFWLSIELMLTVLAFRAISPLPGIPKQG